jgi:hypothetical protein
MFPATLPPPLGSRKGKMRTEQEIRERIEKSKTMRIYYESNPIATSPAGKAGYLLGMAKLEAVEKALKWVLEEE